jgi:alkanesulfonate monooxygenase SsuD/methylene tetrahydromethanopterin reductase-like flavin-dependent oxidoreductase (luciferase family)
MVGGNGLRRTIPLAARYADVWNGIWLSPDEFLERSQRLDELTRAAGRRPGDVRRTLDAALFFGRDRADLERRLGAVRASSAELADLSHDALIARLRQERRAVAGTAEEVVAQLQTYAAVGVDEVMFQLQDLDDIPLLRDVAELVLPRLGD